MNTIDIVCLVVIAILTLMGLWQGLLRGIFRLLAWVSAIAGAYYMNKCCSDFVANLLQSSSFSTTLVCICLGFLIPFLLFLFLGHWLKNHIKDTAAGKVDRILGGIFGFIKALLIIFVFMTILHIFPFGGVIPETRNDAVAYDLYKGLLDNLGYSSEPIDLVDIAEKKATDLTKKITNKAADKAEKVVKESAEKAAQNVANEIAKEAAEKASNVSQKITDKIGLESDSTKK